MPKSIALSAALMVLAAPVNSQPPHPGASAHTLQNGRLCAIAATSGGTTFVAAKPAVRSATAAPVAVTNTTGEKKPYKLVNGDPSLPATARPDGGDTLNGRIDQQNANNPASGATSSSGTATGTSSGSGSGSGGQTGNCR